VSTSAVFFDLDKTIIARSSLLAFTKPFSTAGLISKKRMLKNVVNQYFFATVGANHAQMERLRESLTAMVTGWSVDQVKEIINESIHSAIGPMIYDEAATLIEKHISDGRDIIIVSTSGKEIVEPIGKLLGATTVIATEMIIEDGKYTGAVAFYAYGEKKAEAIKKLAAEKGYDLSLSFAYSDSVTDLPMLKSVGFPCAVNPDRALRAEAEKLDWPILSFSRSVPLRDRLSGVPRKPALATALSLGAFVTLLLVKKRKSGKGEKSGGNLA
jgi:HAD superfamily hydrolase (TIGR01490 family)